jgi:signal transduction histidine kinase
MLQQCIACGILAVDSENKILTLASETETAQRAAKQESLSFQKLPASVQSIIRDVQTTGRAVIERQAVLNLKSSGASAFTLSAIPVTTAKQNLSVVVMIKELSSPADKNMGENLQRLDRLASLGLLSASVAHEIKNALVAIKTFVELLPDKNPDPELTAVVRREVARVDSIVSQMLKFAAPSRPAFSSVRMHDLLEHSLRLVQHRADHHPISFQCDFNARPDTLNGDEHQLEQAFVNLLFNAVDAMKFEGTLTVVTDLIADTARMPLHEDSGPRKMLRIKITDTGMGISSDNLGQIFEPFFTTKQNGTGLGLSVTRRIIEEHSGAIHVESVPGKGTTFIVLLPAG